MQWGLVGSHLPSLIGNRRSSGLNDMDELIARLGVASVACAESLVVGFLKFFLIVLLDGFLQLRDLRLEDSVHDIRDSDAILLYVQFF